MKKKVYYAHCASIYNTPQEKRDIELLQGLGFDVVNPNDPKHQKASSMGYFIKLALSCEILAFRGLPDGRIPAGIATEIFQFDGYIIELPSGLFHRKISVEETREYLMEVGQR